MPRKSPAASRPSRKPRAKSSRKGVRLSKKLPASKGRRSKKPLCDFGACSILKVYCGHDGSIALLRLDAGDWTFHGHLNGSTLKWKVVSTLGVGIKDLVGFSKTLRNTMRQLSAAGQVFDLGLGK